MNKPIRLQTQSAVAGKKSPYSSLTTFSSYSFQRSILQSGNPFRFTASGTSKDQRMSIRSGDLVQLYVDQEKSSSLLATGILDESDCHIDLKGVDYVLTGRDLVGQLIDNAAVDAENNIVHVSSISILDLANLLIKNTRIPKPVRVNPPVPSGTFLFNTNPGEAKISALMRFLEYTNCLVWSANNGQIVIGKPNMAQAPISDLTLSYTDPTRNNLLDARVRRNTNQAIRQIAYVLQDLQFAEVQSNSFDNSELESLSGTGVGRSVLQLYSQGDSQALVNLFQGTGTKDIPYSLGASLAFRQLARENVHILEVEVLVPNHVDRGGNLYDVDQIYQVSIEDEDVNEPMYCYSARYDMSLDHGMTTSLKLCKLGPYLVDGANQL